MLQSTLHMIQLNNYIYVVNHASNTVSIIDSSNNTVIKTIFVKNGSKFIAYNPDDRNIYISSPDSNTVSIIDSSNNTVIKTIFVKNKPGFIAYNPDDRNIYVTNGFNNTVSVFATTEPIQPPTATTITSDTNGNGNSIQNDG